MTPWQQAVAVHNQRYACQFDWQTMRGHICEQATRRPELELPQSGAIQPDAREVENR